MQSRMLQRSKVSLWQLIGTWQYIGHDCLTGTYIYADHQVTTDRERKHQEVFIILARLEITILHIFITDFCFKGKRLWRGRNNVYEPLPVDQKTLEIHALPAQEKMQSEIVYYIRLREEQDLAQVLIPI